MKLEEHIRDTLENGNLPVAILSILVVIQVKLEGAWENGCEVGFRDGLRDAQVILGRNKTLKTGKEDLENEIGMLKR